MKYKKNNLTKIGIRSIYLKNQASLELFHSLNLKKRLSRFFQAVLLVSAFLLQAPETSFFELNPSFKGPVVSETSFKGPIASETSFKFNSSFKQATWFAFNVSVADKYPSCKEKDSIEKLESKLDKLDDQLTKTNKKLNFAKDNKSFEKERATAMLEKQKIILEKIDSHKERCKELRVQQAEKRTTEEETLEKEFECEKDSSDDNIEDKIRNIDNELEDLRDGEYGSLDDYKNYFKNKGYTKITEQKKAFRSYLRDNKETCEALQKDNKQCKSAKEDFQEARTDYKEDCATFIKSDSKCEEFIKGCQVCYNAEAKNDSYDCVKVHEKSMCPELAGQELEKVKELIEDYEKDRDDIKENLQEKQEDLVKKQAEFNNELNTMEEEFNSSIDEFKIDTENHKTDLKNNFTQNRQSISNGVNEQIAAVQEQIDKTLEISYGFENAITNALIKHGDSLQQINRECREEAFMRLNTYRQNRRKAIKSGIYQISFSKLISKNRINFHQQDQNLFKYYNNFCLNSRKKDIEKIDLIYQLDLRGIEQKKNIFSKNIQKMRDRLQNLVQVASQNEKNLISQYVKDMNDTINSFESKFNINIEKYNKEKQIFLMNKSSEINQLKGQIDMESRTYQEIEKSLHQQRSLENYMKSKGVSEEEDNKDAYRDIVGSFGDYESTKTKYLNKCGCGDEDNYNSRKCPDISTDRDTRRRRSRGQN